MANYAKMFYDMGYNVLLPDDRAHGDSAGEYISFGWLDRLDYLSWINKLLAVKGEDERILLFGVSMGGATMEMLSGENLPTQVKAIIADCGYSSIKEELIYLLKEQYHLPEYPFEPMVSTINRQRLGYYLGDVSSKHSWLRIVGQFYSSMAVRIPTFPSTWPTKTIGQPKHQNSFGSSKMRPTPKASGITPKRTSNASHHS